MNIINHLIDDNEIIGISPMYRNTVGHYVGSFTLSFSVYTKQQQIAITSDAYSFPRELIHLQEAKEEQLSLAFQAEYIDTYKSIWVHLRHNIENLPKYILKLERDVENRKEKVQEFILKEKDRLSQEPPFIRKSNPNKN